MRTAPNPVGRGRLGALVVSQLIAGVGVASGIAVGGLLAERLTGSESLAGFASTSSVLGAGVWAVPLARLAGRRGRRWGLSAGYLLAAAGVLMIFLATVLGWVPLLFVGFGFFGAATAAGLQARFAATEASTPHRRARAMSFVLWATTVGSVAGPNLSSAGARLGRGLGLQQLTGPYLFSLVAFCLAAAVIAIGWRVSPGLPDSVSPEAGSQRAVIDSGDDPRPGARLPRGPLGALRQAVRRPPTLLAVVTITCSQTVMVGVMVMTPVHMYDDGFGLDLVGLVISVHILGMYGASPLFGWLTDKISARGVIVVAVLIFATALGIGVTTGTARMAPMSVCLGLLGLGWSAGMIGGSTLLAETVPDALRTSVQGSTDAIMNLAAAASSALSGVVMGLAGFPGLSVVAAVVVVPMAVLALRRPGVQPPAPTGRPVTAARRS